MPSSADIIEAVLEESGPDYSTYSYEEVPGDTRTVVYFVTIEYSGESYEVVLKLAPEGNSTFAVEPFLHTYIAERTAVPVPEILAFRPDPEQDVPPYFVTERIRGENLDDVFRTLSPEQRSALMEQVGRILGDLHSSIAFEGYGRLALHNDHLIVRDLSGDWRAYFAKLTRKHIDRLSGTTFEDLQTIARNRMDDRIQSVPRQGVPRLVHDDFRPGNLLVETDDSPKITAVLDWEQSLAGDPRYNLAEAEFLFIDSVVRDSGAAEQMREHLYEGYRSERTIEPDAAYEACRPLYQLSTLIWRMSGFDSTYDEDVSPLARSRAEAYYREQFTQLEKTLDSTP